MCVRMFQVLHKDSFQPPVLSISLYILFCVQQTWEHVSVHWQQDRYSNYERISSRVGAQFRTRASESPRHLPPPTVKPNVLTTRLWRVRQKRIGTRWMASHIEHSSESILSKTILHWTAYTWHWRIDIILYGGDMRTIHMYPCRVKNIYFFFSKWKHILCAIEK